MGDTFRFSSNTSIKIYRRNKTNGLQLVQRQRSDTRIQDKSAVFVEYITVESHSRRGDEKMLESLKEYPPTPRAYTDRELIEYAERYVHEGKLTKEWQLELIKRLAKKINLY